MRTIGALIALALLPAAAQAACEAQHKALGQASGADVVPAFRALATCDDSEADKVFLDVMKRTNEVDSLTALALAALESGIIAPVQAMAEHIPVGAREQVTSAVGARCTEDGAALQVVTGLHEAVRDRGYAAWSAGLQACDDDGFTAWVESAVKAPPPHTFDDKYNTVLEVWAKRKGTEALPALQAAAEGSLGGGPFQMILDAMQRSVTPEGLNAKPNDADRTRLIAALAAVAANSSSEQAAAIANRMITVGAESDAVTLLPRIYPKAVQSGGGFVYGVASVERCDDDAVLHWAEVHEPGKRWRVQGSAEEAARAFKARLKCDAGDWEVRHTAGPVANAGEVETWAEGLAGEFGDAKLRDEKPIELQ